MGIPRDFHDLRISSFLLSDKVSSLIIVGVYSSRLSLRKGKG